MAAGEVVFPLCPRGAGAVAQDEGGVAFGADVAVSLHQIPERVVLPSGDAAEAQCRALRLPFPETVVFETEEGPAPPSCGLEVAVFTAFLEYAAALFGDAPEGVGGVAEAELGGDAQDGALGESGGACHLSGRHVRV